MSDVRQTEPAEATPADPMPGAGRAIDFARQVRLGEHLERVRKHGLELGCVKARLLDLVMTVEEQIQETASIAEAIAKDRGGR